MEAIELPALETTRVGWPYTDWVNASIYTNLPRLPKVSVLVPSYNQGNFLEMCLRSLVAQQYPNLEILVADGGSTDNSVTVINHYSPYLAWAVSEKDNGTWDADNKALAKATGEYVLVLNSDDYLLKGGLYFLLKALLASPEAPWVTGPVHAVNEGAQIKAIFTPKPPAGATPGRTFLKECWIFHPGTLIRRDLIGNFSPVHVMDWELWVRLERQGLLPVISPCPVAALRFHTDCKSYDSAGMYLHNYALMERLAHHYTGGLQQEKRYWHQKWAEARMVAFADQGEQKKALLLWLNYGATHPALLVNRPYLGLGRRLLSKNLADIYRPMAFLDKDFTPLPPEPACTF